MYSVGEKIVHPMHGAGVIREIVQETHKGVSDEYYLMHVPFINLDVRIPTNRAESAGVRPVISREEAETIIHSGAQETDVQCQSNWNARYKENLSRITSGDTRAVLGVVRQLLRRADIKTLSSSELKMLRTARQILVSELSVALDREYSDVDEYISTLLTPSPPPPSDTDYDFGEV